VNVKLIAAGSAAALALCGAGAAVAANSGHSTQVGGSEAVGAAFDAALAYLNIDKLTLARDLRSGQSLAQIASAQGKTAGGLVDAVVAAAQQQLDGAVAAGKLSSATEQLILTKLGTSLGALVTKRFGGAGLTGNQQRPRPVTMFLQPLLARLQLRLQTLPNGQPMPRLSVTHGKTSIAGNGNSS
jgi:hypothetical protein